MGPYPILREATYHCVGERRVFKLITRLMTNTWDAKLTREVERQPAEF